MAGQVAGPYFVPGKGKIAADSEEGDKTKDDMTELETNRNMGHTLFQYILNAYPGTSDDLRTTTSVDESECSSGSVSDRPVPVLTEGLQPPSDSRLQHPNRHVRAENGNRRYQPKHCHNSCADEQHASSRKTPTVLRHTWKSRYSSNGTRSSHVLHHDTATEAGLDRHGRNRWLAYDSFEDLGIEQTFTDLQKVTTGNPETPPCDNKALRLVDTARQDRHHDYHSSPTDDSPFRDRGGEKGSAIGNSPDQRSSQTRSTFCSSRMSHGGGREADLAQGRAVLHTYRRKSSADLAQDLLKYQGKHKMSKYNGEHGEANVLKRPHTAPPTTAGQTAEFMLQRAYFSLEHADIKRRNAEIIKMQQEHTRHHQRLKRLFDLEWQQQQMRNMHLYARDHGNSDGSFHDLSNMHHFNRTCCHGNEDHHGGERKGRANKVPPDGNQKDGQFDPRRPLPFTGPIQMSKEQPTVADTLEQTCGADGKTAQKHVVQHTSRTRRKERTDRMKERQRRETEHETRRKAEIWSTKMKWEPVKL